MNHNTPTWYDRVLARIGIIRIKHYRDLLTAYDKMFAAHIAISTAHQQARVLLRSQQYGQAPSLRYH